MSPRFFPTVAAVAILIASGLAQNRWSDGRESAEALRSAAERIGRLPLTIGDWSGTATPFDPRGLDRAGIAGLVARRYVDRKTGAAVSLLLVCGPPGPIAAHGPEVCYAGSGYEAVADPVRRASGDGDAFWLGEFRKAGNAPPPVAPLRIAWAWSDDGRWRAADRPRLAFAGKTVLYKLYLVFEPAAPGADPRLEFAGQLAPVLKSFVFSKGGAFSAGPGPQEPGE